MLEDILDPKSFVLDNLEEVRTANRLNLSEAIKSKDEDFLLLFKDIGEERVPASLMKIKGDIKADLSKTDEKIILGVIIEKDGKVNIHRVNEDYVKDGGEKMLSIVKNNQFEPFKDEPNLQNIGGINMNTSGENDIKNNEVHKRTEELLRNNSNLERDSDGDGISDEQEKNQGTNPFSSDTDGDGKSSRGNGFYFRATQKDWS